MVADWVKGREWAAGRPRQGRSRAEAGPQGKGRLRGADRRARRMAAVLGNCPRARQARQGGWSWAAGRVQGGRAGLELGRSSRPDRVGFSFSYFFLFSLFILSIV
jgi:hypothetical protein